MPEQASTQSYHLPERGTLSSATARGAEGAKVLFTLSFMVLAKKSVHRKGQLPAERAVQKIDIMAPE